MTVRYNGQDAFHSVRHVILKSRGNQHVNASQRSARTSAAPEEGH